MQRLRVFTLLLILFAPLICLAQEPVSLYGGHLKWELPKGMFGVTPEAIKTDYLGKSPPQHVYRNRTGDVSIAFNHMNKPVKADDLAAFATQLEADLKKKWPDLEWVGHEMVLLNGVRWFQLEFKSREQGYTLHNWVLGTPLQGRLLEVSLTAFDDFDPSALLEAKYSLRLTNP